ncbi:MAG: hypothetical protein GY754_16495 [bacterium]|nr:hypothetical protein [bacterium]
MSLNEFPNLKVDLAHYGGFDQWEGTIPAGLDDWRDDITKLIQENNYVYTDISNFLIGKDSENVNKIINKIIYGPRGLVERISENSKLKNRITIGSDWFMGESSEVTYGNNYAHLFKLFKKLSEEVGFDAWNQFAIINPLRFLGIIDDDVEVNGEIKLIPDENNSNKFIKCKKNMIKLLNSKAFRKNSKLSWKEAKKIKKERIPRRLEQLKNIRIKNSRATRNLLKD